MHADISELASRVIAWTRETAHPARIVRGIARGLAGLFLVGQAALLLFILLASLVLLGVNPPVTALMVYRRVTEHQKAQPIRFVPYAQIPRALRNMVTRLEDYRFWEHNGVDLGALHDAWDINSSIGRTVVGGSTIPMQLSRNLFLTPRKTYFRKYVEAVIALEMSRILPKERVLELYLNCIEWGPGVFGIGSASAYYYKAKVGSLGLDSLRRLATIISSPRRFSVQTLHKSAQMRERYAYLVSRFPDPSAEPTDTGKVAPVPDAPDAAADAAPTVEGAPPAEALAQPGDAAPAEAAPPDGSAALPSPSASAESSPAVP
jgi:monofunctional glycosyltransferase